jgi:hypothetical protein
MTENRAALLAEIAANVPDNTSGEVTPLNVRQTLLDMVNNMVTLLDAQTLAAIMTFSVAPVMTSLNGVLQANGGSQLTALTNAQLKALTSGASIPFTATGVNLNSIADTVIPITLPSGFTRFKVSALHISNASISLTTAQIALYSAASAGGFNIVAPTVTGITSTATDTNLNSFAATIIDTGTITFNDANIYFRVTTAQGAAATADVTLIITPLP